MDPGGGPSVDGSLAEAGRCPHAEQVSECPQWGHQVLARRRYQPRVSPAKRLNTAVMPINPPMAPDLPRRSGWPAKRRPVEQWVLLGACDDVPRGYRVDSRSALLGRAVGHHGGPLRDRLDHARAPTVVPVD